MTTSTTQPERAEEFYQKIMARDAELIEAQDKEIAKLKVKINQLQQKLNRYKTKEA